MYLLQKLQALTAADLLHQTPPTPASSSPDLRSQVQQLTALVTSLQESQLQLQQHSQAGHVDYLVKTIQQLCTAPDPPPTRLLLAQVQNMYNAARASKHPDEEKIFDCLQDLKDHAHWGDKALADLFITILGSKAQQDRVSRLNKFVKDMRKVHGKTIPPTPNQYNRPQNFSRQPRSLQHQSPLYQNQPAPPTALTTHAPPSANPTAHQEAPPPPYYPTTGGVTGAAASTTMLIHVLTNSSLVPHTYSDYSSWLCLQVIDCLHI